MKPIEIARRCAYLEAGEVQLSAMSWAVLRMMVCRSRPPEELDGLWHYTASVAHLSQKLNLSSRSVRRVINELVTWGFLRKEEVPGMPSTYRIQGENLGELLQKLQERRRLREAVPGPLWELHGGLR